MDVPLFLAILAECLTRAGDRDGAIEVLDEAFARIGRNRSFFYLPELYRMSADLLLARGDSDTARAALERARTIADEQQSPLFRQRVAESLGRAETV
jgi:tetratricopeptide (TPR) repeat protein